MSLALQSTNIQLLVPLTDLINMPLELHSQISALSNHVGLDHGHLASDVFPEPILKLPLQHVLFWKDSFLKPQ